MNDPRYPIGKFEQRDELTSAERRQMIDEIAATPTHMRDAIAGLTPAQLHSPYREGGWTLRQVVHHVPDSHMNAYVRWKLALTEDQPTIKPYEEARWAELVDTKSTPIEVSLALLDNLHDRWVRLLRSISDSGFSRTFRHPDHGVRTLDWMLFLYEWHGKHHTAHITELRKSKGW